MSSGPALPAEVKGDAKIDVDSYADEEVGQGFDEDADDVRRPGVPQDAGRRRPRRGRSRGPEWVETGPRQWRGEFRNVRALRLPPGLTWSEVLECHATDAQTGEVIDTRLDRQRPAEEIRRLDRVRDLRIVVVAKAVEDENVDSWVRDVVRVRPIEKKARWSDIASDEDT